MTSLDLALCVKTTGARGAPPAVLLLAGEGSRSVLLSALTDCGLAVLMTPAGTAQGQVDTGVVDLVLVHLEPRAAMSTLVELRQCSAVPIIVAVRDGRTSLDPFLEAGADDCVASGVPREELLARLRAVLRRRSRDPRAELLRVGALSLDLARRVFSRDGIELHLPPKEFGLLELLMRRDGRVVSREEALAEVWGPQRGGDPTTVDVHVKRLRTKVEDDPARPTRLMTVRGLGYRLQP